MNFSRNYPTADKTLNGFVPAYSELGSKIGPEGHVLELGVREGTSLLMWKELFPDGLVAGVDNDAEGESRWPEGTVEIRASQDSQEMADAARAASRTGYDLIVDDASHVGELTAKSFSLLWPMVRPGCWYVIEDWHLGYQPEWKDWHNTGDSMLNLAVKILTMFGSQANRYEDQVAGEIDEIRYLWGMIIIHKRALPNRNLRPVTIVRTSHNEVLAVLSVYVLVLSAV